MKLSAFCVGLLAALTPLAAAWSKEDREIFRIRDEVIAAEGADVTFYDILGIASNAGQDDITKAYRKMTRSLHPDKVRQQLISERARKSGKKGSKKPGVNVNKPPSQAEIKAAVKIAGEKQGRLGLIAQILRGPDRERYDHFLSNGFPVWKGTNYYYNRYRPGLGTVMVGLFIVGGGGFHYLALYMSWKRQKEFVERYIKFARQTAWGENLGIPAVTAAPRQATLTVDSDYEEEDSDAAPAPTNRRERRLQQKNARRDQGKKTSRRKVPATTAQGEPAPAGPSGTRKRVVAENGKVLLVDSLGDVYLEEEGEDGNVEFFLLDPNELPKPTIKDTAVFRVPVWAYDATVGRVLPLKKDANADDAELKDEDDDDSEPAQHTPSTDSAAEDFELLDKSVDSLGKAKSTGAQAQGSSKKRKNKKR